MIALCGTESGFSTLGLYAQLMTNFFFLNPPQCSRTVMMSAMPWHGW